MSDQEACAAMRVEAEKDGWVIMRVEHGERVELRACKEDFYLTTGPRRDELRAWIALELGIHRITHPRPPMTDAQWAALFNQPYHNSNGREHVDESGVLRPCIDYRQN